MSDPMPQLVRLYIRQVLIGFALAGVFVALLLGINVAGLRRLLFGSESGLLAAFLLFFFNGLVFAGAQFAMTIMRMAESQHPPRGLRRSGKGALLNRLFGARALAQQKVLAPAALAVFPEVKQRTR